MNTASIEWLAGVVRVWPTGKRYGDPYLWCATIRVIDLETVEIMGAMTAPELSEWRAIQAELLRLGFKRARWTRRHGDDVRVIEFQPKGATA